AGELRRAGTGEDRFRQGAVGKRGDGREAQRRDAASQDRHAGRDRSGRCVPGGPGIELHHRPGDRGGWRRDDCVNPSPRSGKGGRERSERTGGPLQQVTPPRRFAPTLPFQGRDEESYFFFWLWSWYLRSS